MPTKGFPQLQELYQLLGAPKLVEHHPLIQFPHNYNYVSRKAMYQWVNQHLQLGLPAAVIEEDYPRLTPKELTVWDEPHPKPTGGDDFERGLLRWWHEDAQKQLAAARPTETASRPRYQEIVGKALDVVIGRRLPAPAEVAFEQTARNDAADYAAITGLIRNQPRHEELPVVLLQPKQPATRVAIWLHRNGKGGLFQDDGQPQPPLRRLLGAGTAVVGADLLYQGEFLADSKPVTQTRRVKNPREAAAYTFGYNHTLFAQRVHDVLTLIAFARKQDPQPVAVALVGLDGTGPWAAAARAVAGDAVSKAAIDTSGFRFGKVLEIHSPDFLPGGAKYDDLPGMLAIAVPQRLWLAGETADTASVTSAAYRAAGAEKNLVVYAGPASDVTSAAVAWLLSSE
jgi:hypothetical protein